MPLNTFMRHVASREEVYKKQNPAICGVLNNQLIHRSDIPLYLYLLRYTIDRDRDQAIAFTRSIVNGYFLAVNREFLGSFNRHENPAAECAFALIHQGFGDVDLIYPLIAVRAARRSRYGPLVVQWVSGPDPLARAIHLTRSYNVMDDELTYREPLQGGGDL